MKNYYQKQNRDAFLRTPDLKVNLVINLVISIVYFVILAFFVRSGETLLFTILILGEVFHLFQTIAYALTIWETSTQAAFAEAFTPSVAVFITVAGEPAEVLRTTLEAALAMDYPNFKVYILNDGYARGSANWKVIRELGKSYGVTCLMRPTTKGAKAGNINYALKHTASEFVMILDTDHVPEPDFLKKVMGYFIDPYLGFIQTPQYYANQDNNFMTKVAWEQQSVFFGPIMQGKNASGSAFMCGTNMVLRRQTLNDVGGMCEENIAEDFVTSLFIHQRGWRSLYIPEVLAEGMAPEDFLSYYKQQLRWARGSMEVMFRYNPTFRKGLRLSQKIQYLASASYYLSGLVVLMDLVLPLIFFFTGAVPIVTATMRVALIFLPYIFSNILILMNSTNNTFSFKALTFSVGAFPIHISAFYSLLTGRTAKFEITSKQKLSGVHPRLIRPHLIYMFLCVVGATYAAVRTGWTDSVVANVTWAALNIMLLLPFIYAALNLDSLSFKAVWKSPAFLLRSVKYLSSGITISLPRPQKKYGADDLAEANIYLSSMEQIEFHPEFKAPAGLERNNEYQSYQS